MLETSTRDALKDSKAESEIKTQHLYVIENWFKELRASVPPLKWQIRARQPTQPINILVRETDVKVTYYTVNFSIFVNHQTVPLYGGHAKSPKQTGQDYIVMHRQYAEWIPENKEADPRNMANLRSENEEKSKKYAQSGDA